MRSQIPIDLKIKMNGKRLFHTKKKKYLGIYIDESLAGNEHCEELSKKLCRSNGILAKSRHVSSAILKNILLCYCFIKAFLWFPNLGTNFY